ncbi:MAG: hypothetical protein JST54_10945 [Deltaproteobacteria bacterium]|nr:hypothetical protein [Deltaproteobacteria bacterium]
MVAPKNAGKDKAAAVAADRLQAAEETQKQLEEYEAEVAELKAKHDQYFLGLERLEPIKERESLKKRLNALRTSHIRNTGLKFKAQSLWQKFLSYERMWMRIAREIEEGTYSRDLFKARMRGEKRAKKEEKRDQAEAQENNEINEQELLAGGDLESALAEAASSVDKAKAREPKTDPHLQAAKAAEPELVRPLGSDELIRPKSAAVAPQPPPPPISSKVSGAFPKLPPPPPPEAAPKPVTDPQSARPPPPPPPPSSKTSGSFGKLPPPSSPPPGAPTKTTGSFPKLGATPPPPPPQPGGLPSSKTSGSFPRMPPPPPAEAGAKPVSNPAAVRPAPPPPPAAAGAKTGPAVARPPPPPPGARPGGAGGALPDDKMRAIYNAYMAAKKQCKESTDGITYESVSKTINTQMPEVMKQHNAKAVDFKVVIKNGKATLKAVPRT